MIHSLVLVIKGWMEWKVYSFHVFQKRYAVDMKIEVIAYLGMLSQLLDLAFQREAGDKERGNWDPAIWMTQLHIFLAKEHRKKICLVDSFALSHKQHFETDENPTDLAQGWVRVFLCIKRQLKQYILGSKNFFQTTGAQLTVEALVLRYCHSDLMKRVSSEEPFQGRVSFEFISRRRNWDD